jgi:hypothetical protein
MNTYQHQLSVKIAETLEQLQDLNPDLYGLRYSQLYAPYGNPENWTESMLHQIEQDLIDCKEVEEDEEPGWDLYGFDGDD